MPLTGTQYGELIETLLEAFHWASLGQLVRIKFEIDLATEIGGAAAPFRTVATDWVKWLEQRGRTADFVGYMWAERKTVERVSRFYKSYLGQAAEVAGPPVAADFGAARDKVIEFKLYFRESESQFGYLNAFKDLHDRLHTLHEMREGIAQAAERLRKLPPDSTALEIVAEDLQAQVLGARKSAATLEEPADARWLEAFANGVEGLAPCAPGAPRLAGRRALVAGAGTPRPGALATDAFATYQGVAASAPAPSASPAPVRAAYCQATTWPASFLRSRAAIQPGRALIPTHCADCAVPLPSKSRDDE